MNAAVTEDRLEAIRANHTESDYHDGAPEQCFHCGDPWPCDTARVLAALAAVIEERDREEMVASQMQSERDAARADFDHAVQRMQEAVEDAVRWRADAERLAAALDGMIAPRDEPCRYDHHGYCQEHSLGNPCEVAQAREALAAHRSLR